MKKILKTWASLVLILAAAVFLPNWANHQNVVLMLKSTQNFVVFWGAALAVGLIRRFYLRLSFRFVEIFSLSLLFAFFIPRFFDKVPASHSDFKVIWITALSLAVYSGLFLGWEWIGAGLKKLPLASLFYPKVFVLVLVGGALILCCLKPAPTDMVVFIFVGLVPALRVYLFGEKPQVLTAFLFYFFTAGFYRLCPDVSGYSYAYVWRMGWPLGGQWWGFVDIIYPLLISAVALLFWEKLKRSKSFLGAIYFVIFAALPMAVIYFFGYGNGTWVFQLLALGLLWGWNPWLKPYEKDVFLALGSAAGLYYTKNLNGSWTVPMIVVVLTVLTTQLRQQLLKLPQALIRALAFYTLAGVLYAWHPSHFLLVNRDRADWALAFQLALSAVCVLFWEKLKEPQNRKLRIGVWLFALLPIPFDLYYGTWAWPVQVLALYLFQLFETREKKQKDALLKPPPPPPTSFSPKKDNSLALWMRKPIVRIALIAVLLAAAGVMIYQYLYNISTTHVVSFTPTGTVTSANTVIRAKFSSEVQVVSALDSAFEIDPPLPGTTRLEDSTTLVFTPAAPLKPATTYTVHLNVNGKLKSKDIFMQGKAQTVFSTELMKVVASRLFYTYDIVKGTEKELMGEIEFNYPVEMSLLQGHMSVTRGGNPLNFELEQGTLPTRFFFKAGGFERTTETQTLTVTIAAGLHCVDCGKPLMENYKNTIELPAKPKMLVDTVKLHHVPGTSLISILFTLPPSPDQVRNYVTISPALPFKVDTEYCYAVLKADFQPNVDYVIHVRAGLPALSGEILEKNDDQGIRLEDVPPYVRFADSGRLIPLQGEKIVAVKTMNLDDYQVDVQKVFRNNIVDFLKNWRSYPNYAYQRQYGNRGYTPPDGDDDGDGDQQNADNYQADSGSTYGLGVPVWNGNVTVQGGQINLETESALTFSKWHSQPYKGLFVVSLTGADGGGRDSRSFLCTDLGMVMKRSGDDLLVQVLSISKLTPVAGVKLQLISDNNQVIQEKETDLQGRVWFKDWKNNPYNFNPFVVVAQLGDDWSFLRMDQGALNSSRFDVGGDPFESTGWDAFLTSDRGLYRPGDTANFTAVVRHSNLEIPENLPVNLIIRDGSNNQVAKYTTKLRQYGMTTFAFPINGDITTGMFRVELMLENGVHLASTSIKVEEFIPNKIKIDIKPAKTITGPGEELSFRVSAHQLFGAPGAGLKVHTVVQLGPLDYQNKDWKSYHFSDITREFTGENLTVPDGTTDAAGNYDVKLPVPPSMLPPSMMQAQVYAEVLDTGGRPVAGNASINVHRYPYYLGLKSVEGKDVVPQKKVHIKFIAITPDGKLTSVKKAVLLVKRKVWYSIFRRSGWSGRGYESAFYEQVIDGKEIDVDGKGTYTFTPDKPGEYTIYLGNEDGMRSSIMVAVSGPEEKDAQKSADLDEPEKLSLNLNKTQYGVGEIPRLEVRAPFAGKLILSIEREKVFYASAVTVTAGLNVLTLPALESDYMPNAYVVGLLVRKPEEAQRTMPMSSFGIAVLTMNTSSHQIKLKWKSPEAVKSKDGIDVKLSTGVPGTKVVLAAVDEGILQIVSFTTPDPFKYFYRKRGLTTSTLSLFDSILPDLERKDAVGGDEGESFKARHLNPIQAKRVKSFAIFSGILTADKKGNLYYHFPTDKFHGEVRVMALGVDGNKFGAAAYHVKVADPVVVDPSFPRFLAPGDHFDVPVLVYNNTKKQKALKVKISVEGPAAIDGQAEQELSLEGDGQQQILFHAKAQMDAGVARFKVTVTDEDGNTFDVTTELAVRPGNPLTTQISFGPLGGGSSQSLSVPGGFIPEGQKVRLTVSSSPLLTFLGSMDYLIHYPYGCAEQRTSQAFPLLYFKDMGLLTGRFDGNANAVQMYVQDAIDDLSKMQLSDGSFELWPGQEESGGDYLSNYVSQFLLAAQKAGYPVNEEVLDKIYDRLGAIKINGEGVGRLDRRKQNVEIQNSAYVLYLKVLADRPDAESMAAMKAQIQSRSLSDRCYLSLAYTALGDRTTALSLLPEHYLPSSLARLMSGDWFSPNRERALYLLALTEADPTNPEIPQMIVEFGKTLKGTGRGWFGTTQEDALCFMAIGKAVKATTESYPLSAQWSLKNGTPNLLTGETALVKSEKLSGNTVVLQNNGTQEIYYHLMAEGTKLQPEKESISNGLILSREYRDEKGNLINLGSVAQGQLVVVTLHVKCTRQLDNLVVVDLLPAGFEVDNPRLSSRGNLLFQPSCSFSPVFQDFRDDRVLLFSRDVIGDQTFSYSVRAVTPGSFQVPGLEAEAMYDPDIFGRSNYGETLIIAPAKY